MQIINKINIIIFKWGLYYTIVPTKISTYHINTYPKKYSKKNLSKVESDIGYPKEHFYRFSNVLFILLTSEFRVYWS